MRKRFSKGGVHWPKKPGKNGNRIRGERFPIVSLKCNSKNGGWAASRKRGRSSQFNWQMAWGTSGRDRGVFKMRVSKKQLAALQTTQKPKEKGKITPAGKGLTIEVVATEGVVMGEEK